MVSLWNAGCLLQQLPCLVFTKLVSMATMFDFHSNHRPTTCSVLLGMDRDRYYPRPSGLQQFGTLPPQPSTLGMRSVPEENFKSFADSRPLFAPDTFTSDDPLISFELPTISHVQPVFDQRTIETSYKRPNYVVDEKQEEHGRNTSSNKKPRLESHPSSVSFISYYVYMYIVTYKVCIPCTYA